MKKPADTKPVATTSATPAILFVAVVCVLLIGATGTVKYQLDRSELALASPESVNTANQELFEKTIYALGYGGFLGASQFVLQHDHAALGTMKENLKTAQDALTRLTDKATAATRHDIQAIIDIDSGIMLKAEQSFDTPPAAFSANDLIPAYSALPTLDARLQSALASNRTEAQANYKLWGLGLTMIAWCSLILAAAMAASVYLTLRNRQSIPIQALIQAVQNVAQGDMHTTLWGVDRHDIIGDLARAIDKARFHFSQMPDATLQSDTGAIQVKFEGASRSIFDAMMRNMTEDYEKIRAEAVAASRALTMQHDVTLQLSSQFKAALDLIKTHDALSEDAFASLAKKISDQAQTLLQTQEQNVAHITRLVPYMQERAQNMAEVTHIAGKQVTQTLQTLLHAGQDMRSSMGQSQQSVEQLTSSTSGISERLFATMNLLQASGKVLEDTTDNVRSRLNEAVETIGKGEDRLQSVIERAEERLQLTAQTQDAMATLAARAESSAARMETASLSIAERDANLGKQVIGIGERMAAITTGFENAQKLMASAVHKIHDDGGTLNGLLTALSTNNDQLLAKLNQGSQSGFDAVKDLSERSHSLMQKLEEQILSLATKGHDATQQSQQNSTALSGVIDRLSGEQARFVETRTRFTESLDEIGQRLESHLVASFSKTESVAAQSLSKLTNLTDGVDTIVQRLNILGQLTGTLGAVAGQLGQLMPTITNASGGSSSVPQEVISEVQKQGYQAVLQIEAMHEQLAQLVIQQKDQLEMRLTVIDKKLKTTSDDTSLDRQQITVMNDIVQALGKINDHVLHLEDTMQDHGIRKA